MQLSKIILLPKVYFLPLGCRLLKKKASSVRWLDQYIFKILNLVPLDS